MDSVSINAQKCCVIEKKQLVKELKKCDLCSGNYAELHQCYRDAARQSGRRARDCVTG